jgi:hypothetical protein
MGRAIIRLVQRNGIALLALFLALGGTAYAASTALIGPNTVASPQVVNGSLKARDLSAKARKALKGNRGLRGPVGAKGVAGTARAFAVVAADGTVNATLSKNVTVNKNGAGTYCISLAAGIDPATTTLTASVIFTFGGDANTTIQVANPAITAAGNCATGQFEVITRVLVSTAAGSPVTANRVDEAFSLIVA